MRSEHSEGVRDATVHAQIAHLDAYDELGYLEGQLRCERVHDLLLVSGGQDTGVLRLVRLRHEVLGQVLLAVYCLDDRPGTVKRKRLRMRVALYRSKSTV